VKNSWPPRSGPRRRRDHFRDVDAYVRVDVTAIDPPHPSWSVPVRLYFRRLPAAWKLVGLDRTEEVLLRSRRRAM
jgi:hypothetical protein